MAPPAPAAEDRNLLTDLLNVVAEDGSLVNPVNHQWISLVPCARVGAMEMDWKAWRGTGVAMFADGVGREQPDVWGKFSFDNVDQHAARFD